jgi:hypothetical protein
VDNLAVGFGLGIGIRLGCRLGLFPKGLEKVRLGWTLW